MRAYLAVIKDSFREAFASRVLWILLVLITLLLALLAPLGVKDEAAAHLHRSDLKSVGAFPGKLVEQVKSSKPTPGQHIWELLPDDLRERLTALNKKDEPRESRRVLRPLVDALNELLERQDFYDKAAWSRYPLGKEGQQLWERGLDNLSDSELRRFNRLALDAAFPDDISAVPQMATHVVYFTWEVGDAVPLDQEQLDKIVKQVLATVMSLLVGAIGVFVAILVTASIIPHMFEPGAIDLLLSRPLSRSLLFLSKFVGGCTFILLNSAYLIVGLWVYVGLRFGIWSNKLLLCIPVFLFLFAIYYSVSALAGVVWKNAVVSVVITILFWAACFTVGASKEVVETFLLNPQRFAVVVPAGESLLAANKSGDTFQWQPETHTWRPVFRSSTADAAPFGLVYPMIGPVYDSRGDQLVAIASTSPTMPAYAGAGKLAIGKRSEDWQRISSVSTPAGTHALFVDDDGQILIAGTAGLFRFEGDPTVAHVPVEVFGVDIAPQTKAGKFVNVGPEDGNAWLPPFAADRNPENGDVAIFSRGELTILKPVEDGKFIVAAKTDLETKQPALVGYSGKTVVVALGDGKVQVLDADTLKPTATFEPFGDDKPHQVAAASNGRWFAVEFHNNKLWLYDANTGAPLKADIAGQGNISAVAFTADSKLLVADRYPRVMEYDLESDTVERRYETKSDFWELGYRFFLKPVYTIFPKPGELDNMVAYLLTDEETSQVGVENGPENLQAERIQLNIWQPVWSNLVFLAVILGLTCLYIERKDF